MFSDEMFLAKLNNIMIDLFLFSLLFQVFDIDGCCDEYKQVSL